MKRFREWLIPELQRLSDESERFLVFRRAIQPGRVQWCIAAVMFIPTWLWFVVVVILDRHWNQYIDVWLLILMQLAALMVGYLIQRTSIRRNAWTYMRSRFNVPICVICGYDLTGNANGICPECGAAGSVERGVWQSIE